MLVCKLKEKARGLSGNAGAEGNGCFWTFNGDRRHITHENNVDISGKGGYDQKTYHEKDQWNSICPTCTTGWVFRLQGYYNLTEESSCGKPHQSILKCCQSIDYG